MIWKTRGGSRGVVILITCLGAFLSGCVGAAPFTAEPQATRTELPTPSPTARPSQTPTPTSTATPSPTPTETLIPTPTQNPKTQVAPTPELVPQAIDVPAGGFRFRPPFGYQVSQKEAQVNVYSDITGVVISFIGIKTQKHAAVEGVLDGLLKALGERFEDLAASDPYSTPINEAEGLAVPIQGSRAGDKVSGLVSVNSINDQQLFYIIALVPDGPDGPAWNVAGRPVLETVIESIVFYPPVAGK